MRKAKSKKAKPAARKQTRKRWVKHVSETSEAMSLEKGFSRRSSRQIAASLKRSVMASTRTKGTKFQSAMSMLNFFINRGGKGLPKETKARLERAKPELRKIFGKEGEGRKRAVKHKKSGWKNT